VSRQPSVYRLPLVGCYPFTVAQASLAKVRTSAGLVVHALKIENSASRAAAEGGL